MKQEMINYLYTIESELKDLCMYLYNNPEESYKEENSSSYICSLLDKHNFSTTLNYLDIPNSFIATKGSGHPKICFLCEYDSISGAHITGHNALTTISVSAALALGKVLEHLNGSVILIGCPGEYLGGSKAIMTKQGAFDDVDAVLECHPDISTHGSLTSSAIIPLKINYRGFSGLSFLHKKEFNALDALLLTFNILNSTCEAFPKDVEINYVITKGGDKPGYIPSETEGKIYIRSSKISTAEIAESKIKEICKMVTSITDIPHSINLYEPISDELITNQTLNRLFMHNLKEIGVIDINSPKTVYSGLSIGIVSKKVPCIHPFIHITENDEIKYGTLDFAKETTTDYAFEQMKKAALALAYTARDLLEKESLLISVKNDFFSTK